jgi:hypothetical protein
MEKVRKDGKIKWFPIYDRIYKYNFHLCYGGEASDFVEFLVKHHGKDILKDLKLLGNAKGAKLSVENYHYLWISKCPEAEAVMVHELLHLVIGALEDRQIPLTKKTEDTHCYYMEYLYEEIIKVFKKLIK